VPVLVLIRDADRFPVRLAEIRVDLRYPDGTEENRSLLENPMDISNPSWHRVFHLTLHPARRLFITGCIDRGLAAGRERRPNDPKPRLPGPEVLAPPRACCGVSPAGGRWKHFCGPAPPFGIHVRSGGIRSAARGRSGHRVRHRLARGGGDGSFIRFGRFGIKLPDQGSGSASMEGHAPSMRRNRRTNRIRPPPGEELSCANAKGRNIHLLLLNNRNFVAVRATAPKHGSGRRRNTGYARCWTENRRIHSPLPRTGVPLPFPAASASSPRPMDRGGLPHRI